MMSAVTLDRKSSGPIAQPPKFMAGPDPSLADPVHIGARIRAVRAENGLTQDQLAAAVGVSRSAVAQWETGRAGQITGNLTRIASVLAVNVEFLMYGDNKFAPGQATGADEIAMLRLYRACSNDDRQFLLRTAKRLAEV